MYDQLCLSRKELLTRQKSMKQGSNKHLPNSEKRQALKSIKPLEKM